MSSSSPPPGPLTGHSTALPTSRPKSSRSRTSRPHTSISIPGVSASQNVVCAITESRGVAPIVGMAFLNLDSSEAILCQISDTQTYVRTVQKLHLRSPTEALIVASSSAQGRNLSAVLEESLEDLNCQLIEIDRRFFAESTGVEYLNQLALPSDIETIRSALTGNYYALCCFAAVLQYVHSHHSKSFAPHTLRIKFEPSEGAMMIDISTVYSLELIQNLHDPKSKNCLFGLLNETQTPMGARLLRANILQPLTAPATIESRWEAVEELSSKAELFFAVQKALRGSIDADKLLSNLITVECVPTIETIEQRLNHVIMLRQLLSSVKLVHEAVRGASGSLLNSIREYCSPARCSDLEVIINKSVNDDVKYSRNPLDLRYQRAFAIKSGFNGLLDASRTTFKEGSEDAWAHLSALRQAHDLDLELKYDSKRQYYLRMTGISVGVQDLPEDFINVVRRKNSIECSTLTLVKQNQKVVDSHNECIMMSDAIVQTLVERIRTHAAHLFKVSESLALLDVLVAFAHLVTVQEYVRPEALQTFGLQAGRHPIKERDHSRKFVPNDVYATSQRRFQIITGCNMSGKSTYIKTVALVIVMAQIGCFVPANFASLPIYHQLFARINADDNMEANVSSFATEMQESAYILRNLDGRSAVIIDELGRGTSVRDGLAIAIAICEALLESGAHVWFATHLMDLARVLAQRPGVCNLHLAVEGQSSAELKMLYRVGPGPDASPSYGLKVARLVPLPTRILTHATAVADTLEERSLPDEQSHADAMIQRRRRLILELREHLRQARRSSMKTDQLSHYLCQLQQDFVNEMSALEAEQAQLCQSEIVAASMAVAAHESSTDMHDVSPSAISETDPTAV